MAARHSINRLTENKNKNFSNNFCYFHFFTKICKLQENHEYGLKAVRFNLRGFINQLSR